MKNILLALILLYGSFSISKAQVSLTSSAGTTTGSYGTLKAAFDKINDGTHRGTITIQITGNTAETVSASLNASGSGSASYTSVSIYPNGSGYSISGNIDAPLVDLNGADNVTIDGRVNATGTSRNLTITNTSAGSSSSTIKFSESTQNNVVQYCTIRGSATGTTQGIIFFSTATAGTGNNNNTIHQNNITNSGSGRVVNAIYSSGTLSRENSSNIISNNDIYDVFLSSASSNGILLEDNTSNCTISGNSFYETASPFAPGGSLNYTAIKIYEPNGTGFVISGNYIGGRLSQCGGNDLTISASYNYSFTGIDIGVGDSPGTSIQGNIIRNFNCTGTQPQWYGILINNGSTNIGTISPNIIGLDTGTDSIVLSGTGHGAQLTSAYGIYIGSSAETTNIYNNKVGAIKVINDATSEGDFYGIYTNSNSTINIIGNTIGSNSTANSINTTSASTSYAQIVTGIYCSGTPTLTVSNNLIANLTNGTTNSTAGTLGQISGIVSSGGTVTLSNNTVHHLTIANANSSTTEVASVCGIALTGSGDKAITGNAIYNLSNTNASFTGNVTGIYHARTASTNIIQGNFIHSLSVDASSTGASIFGIKMDEAASGSGTATFANNIISLGGNTATTLYGIWENGLAGFANNLYFNTVYIGGSLGSGITNKSYCLFSNANSFTRDFRNNVFTNARTTTSGASLHYATYFNYGTNESLTLNYNDYYISGTGGVMGFYNGSDQTSLPLVTGNDANSVITNPAFLSAGGTVAANYQVAASLPGVTGTGITTDYGLNSRGTINLTIGAWETSINKWKGSTSSDWNTATNWTGGVVPDPDANIIFDDSPANHCQLDKNRSVTSITNTQSTYRMVTNGNKLTIKGSLTFSGGAQIDASAASSNIEFAGTSAQTIPSGTFYNNQVYNLTLNNVNNITLNGTLSLLNTITPTSGFLDAYTNSPTFEYAGSTAQTIGSSSVFLNDRIHNLTINNSSGVTLANTNTLIVSGTLAISSGKLEIAPTGKLTVSGTLTNSAGTTGLVIKSDATGSGSLISGTAGVSATVEQYQTDNPSVATGVFYHMVSMPLTAATAAVYKFTGVQTYMYSYDPAAQAWANITTSSTSLNAGQGYLVNYHLVDVARTSQYAGTLNATAITPAILSTTAARFHLFGNPYPCAIDWDASGWTRTNLGNTYYLWIPSSGSYGIYQTGTGGTLGLTSIISSGQGFFAYSLAGSPALSIPVNAKTHNTSILKSTIEKPPLIKLRISNNANSYVDEAMVIFSPQATTGLDADLDAVKMFTLNTESSQIYTSNTKNLVINALPSNYNDSIPLFFKCNKEASFTLELTENTWKDSIWISDIIAHKTELISKGKYFFEALKTDTVRRFVINRKKSASSATGIKMEYSPKSDISIYARGHKILLINQTDRDLLGDLTIYNVYGRVVYTEKNLRLDTEIIREVFTSGIYLVTYRVGSIIFKEKVVIF